MRYLAVFLVLLVLAVLDGCHRPPEPAPAAAACFATAVTTAVVVAVSEGLDAHAFPPLHLDASACGDVRGVAVAPLVAASASAALALARVGIGELDDPCAVSALTTATLWVDRVGRELGEHLAVGEVVIDVPGELVVCP